MQTPDNIFFIMKKARENKLRLIRLVERMQDHEVSRLLAKLEN